MAQKVLEELHVLMKSGKFSDMKIVCEDTEFDVHKAIVCAQCPTILAYLEQTNLGVFEVKNFKPEIVKQMVDFFYTRDYTFQATEPELDADSQDPNIDNNADDTQLSETADDAVAIPTGSLESHVEVNALATYLDLPALQEKANEKIQTILADQEPCSEWIEAAIKVVHSKDNKLREIFATKIAVNTQELTPLKDFERLMEGRFGVLILERLMQTVAELVTEYGKEAKEKIETMIEKQKLKKEVAAMKKAHEILDHPNSQCRNCSTPFDCSIERFSGLCSYAPSASYIVRCAKCHCKHPG